MIPSPKVATYDMKPEMSAQGVADKVAEVVKSGEYEFVMCNFAPPDMVSKEVAVWYAAVARRRGIISDPPLECAFHRSVTPVSTKLLLKLSPPPMPPSRQFTMPVKKQVTSCSSLPIMEMRNKCWIRRPGTLIRLTRRTRYRSS